MKLVELYDYYSRTNSRQARFGCTIRANILGWNTNRPSSSRRAYSSRLLPLSHIFIHIFPNLIFPLGLISGPSICNLKDRWISKRISWSTASIGLHNRTGGWIYLGSANCSSWGGFNHRWSCKDGYVADGVPKTLPTTVTNAVEQRTK